MAEIKAHMHLIYSRYEQSNSEETLIIPVHNCAGFVGMALSYALSLNVSFVFSIQNQCSLANQIVAVERVKQFMEIQSEAAEVVEEHRPAQDWPQVGRVELRDLKVIKKVRVLHTWKKSFMNSKELIWPKASVDAKGWNAFLYLKNELTGFY